MSYKEEMQKINQQILEAEKLGKKASKVLYIKQIELLEKAHDEFIKRVKLKGYDLSTNLDILEIEIKQFIAMKQIAEKIGISSKKYDDCIKESRVRVYGQEAVDKVFNN